MMMSTSMTTEITLSHFRLFKSTTAREIECLEVYAYGSRVDLTTPTCVRDEDALDAIKIW